MNRMLLEAYHKMPAEVRSIAASLRGGYLRWWRYGPETERLVEAALAREHWSPARWRAWQEERLSFVLCRAAARVPYYQEQWSSRRRHGDRAPWEYLENWPVLEKESLRQNPKSFVVEDRDVRWMFHDRTSGTTGKSLDIWLSHRSVRIWYALFEARWRRWYGVSRHDRWAILGGQLVTPVSQRNPPFWVWNQAMNQLYMSTYHLAPDLIPHYLDALKRYEIKYLWGYPSALSAIAQEALRLGLKDLKIEVVVTNAEPVFDYQRAAIERAFQCPLRETYGMAEAVTAASECEAGRLHLWPEVGLTEVFDGGKPTPCGTGDLICTGLLNEDMPLVRYRVGDMGTLACSQAECGCGRKLPIITSIDGRRNDALLAADGRWIYWLNPVFYGLPVKEAQIVQEARSRITVRYLPTHDFTSAAGHSIVERLRERMGYVEVVLQEVEQIPRAANGKFRAVVCSLPEAPRAVASKQTGSDKGCIVGQ